MRKTKKFVIYSAISNNYNKIISPSIKSSNFDYIMFTDNIFFNKKTNESIWELKEFPDYISTLDPTRKNRFVKTHPHLFFPEYDASIYIDGNIDIIKDPTDLMNVNTIKCLKHSKRNCIYEEGLQCIHQKKASYSQIARQLEKYKNDGYPVKNGLIEGNIIIRNHNNPDVITLMNFWWMEINNESPRDQISFPYSSWKTGIKYEIMPLENPRSKENESHFQIRTNTWHKSNNNLLFLVNRIYNKYITWRLNNLANYIITQIKKFDAK